jgi:hypothetical protein
VGYQGKMAIGVLRIDSEKRSVKKLARLLNKVQQ